jgi:P27 family predicted phage terminase small subunit
MPKTGPKSDLTNVAALPLHDEPQAIDFDRAEALRPGDLKETERLVWDRVAPLLVRLGRLRPHHADAFAEYCIVCVKLKEARKTLDAKEWVYAAEGRNGTQYKSRPEVAQLNDDFRKWRSLASDFGLTPYSERVLKDNGQGDLFDDFESL